MIKTKHLLKVSSAWMSIVYSVCYFGVAIYPLARELFVRYSLHADVVLTSNYFGVGYFFSGLIIWNLIAILAVWLFAFLFNRIR